MEQLSLVIKTKGTAVFDTKKMTTVRRNRYGQYKDLCQQAKNRECT